MEKNGLQGKRCIALARCSTPGQIDTSIDEQLNLLEQFARDQQMVIVDRITLGGVSGSIPANRHELDVLVQRRTERQDFDVLLVQDPTRLTRSGPAHGLYIVHKLRSVGVRVVFAKDDLPEGDMGDVMRGFAYYAAKEQARSISFGTTRGQCAALYSGKVAYCKTPPYGIDRLYTTDDGTPKYIVRNLSDGTQVKLQPETHEVLERFDRNSKTGARTHYRKQSNERIQLIPGDPERVAVVREIFERRYVDGHGYFAIATQLNSRGVCAPRGGAWSVKSVKTIALNPIYRGLGLANVGTRAIYYMGGPKGPVEASTRAEDLAQARPHNRIRNVSDWHRTREPALEGMLDEKVAELAAAKQTQYLDALATGTTPTFSRDRHRDSSYVLKHLLTSKQGGHRMTGRTQGRPGKMVRYYRVTNAFNCPGPNRILRRMLPAEPIERAILEIVRTVLLNVPNLKRRVRDVVECCRRSARQEESDLKSLRARKTLIERKLEFAIDELETIAREVLQRKMNKLQNELRQVEEQIRQVESGAQLHGVDPGEIVERIVEQLKKVGESVDSLPPTTVRRLLEMLIERAEVDLETRDLDVTLRLPAWAIGAVDTLCLDGNPVNRTTVETHAECNAVLVSARCRWSEKRWVPVTLDRAA